MTELPNCRIWLAGPMLSTSRLPIHLLYLLSCHTYLRARLLVLLLLLLELLHEAAIARELVHSSGSIRESSPVLRFAQTWS